jgi:hypothetical protein
MKQRIDNKDYEIIKFTGPPPLEICLLPSDCFCFVYSDSIEVYDQRFNILKTVCMINNTAISPRGIAFSKRNELYISDTPYMNDHSIHMMDFNLNLIKSFGKSGKDNREFYFPIGLVCKNDRLYVCDNGNQRIQILSLDLEYVDTLKLTFQPLSIKISDSTVCISGDAGTYFYDLKTKELKYKYLEVYGRVNKIDSIFFVTNRSVSLKNCCFDQYGKFIMDNCMNDFSEWMPIWWDGCILMLNKYNKSGGEYKILFSKF